MATKASTLLRAARKASLRSRAAAAAASRAAAAAASHEARVAGVAEDIAHRVACLSLGDPVCHHKCFSNSRFGTRAVYDHFPTLYDFVHLPDDSKIPTDKDVESDEAVWALYERWCKAFGKKRDRAEMVRRFKIFKFNAVLAHKMNTNVPSDPKEAAIFQRKRRQAKLLLEKGEDVSHLGDYLPTILGVLADGGDPSLRECDYKKIIDVEEREARRAPKDVTVE